MTIYYPKAVASLRILWENYGNEGEFVLNTDYIFNVTPKSTTVSLNDYTKADTFRIELDYRNFPFDPRAIRACGVTIFIQDLKQHYDRFQNYQELIPKDNKFNFEDSTNVVFVGFADDDDIKFDDQARIVTMEGRDYTGIFIDTPYDNKEPLPLTTAVDNVYATLLARLPAAKNIEIVQLGLDGSELPPPAVYAPDWNPLGSKTRSKERNESYWDVIQSLAKISGLIVYVDRDRLVITKPNALYKKNEINQFIWGKNIKELQFKRKLGRIKNFNIAVRSMHIEKKKVLEAEIPRDANIDWSISTGIPKKRVTVKELLPEGGTREKPANVISFRVADVATKTQLIKIGQAVFEELSRQQLEGYLTTKDMFVPQGNPGGAFGISTTPIEFDLTQLRIGAPIAIRIEQDDQKALAQIAEKALQDRKDLPAKTFPELQQYLVSKGYPAGVAFAFARTVKNIDTAFYTRAIEFTLDSTQGFKMRLEFVNFIENIGRIIN